MSLIVRPAEAGWATVVEMQKEKAESEITRGVKRLISAAGSVPPGGDGPSNLNDMVKMKKFFEMFKFDNTNKIGEMMPNINKQSLAKFLKYLA